VKKFLQFMSWIEDVSEFKTLTSVLWCVVLQIAFLAGTALLYATIFVWPLAPTVGFSVLLGVLLMFPYFMGLLNRISEFNAEKGSWLALLSALI